MASFSNSATLSYQGRVLTSNTATGEILDSLALYKTALSGSYTPGGTLAYAVSITNSGDTALTGLTLSDDLGAYAFGEETLVPLSYLPGSLRLLVNGVPQPAPTAEAGPPLVFSGLSVPAGGSAVLLYEVEVNGYADPQVGGEITNTASLRALSAEATVTAAAGALLEITKTASPTQVPAGGVLTYTFEITNLGNTATQPADQVILTDLVTPLLHGVTVTYEGTVWTEGSQYTYDETTGAFATAAGAITVPGAEISQDTTTGAYTVSPNSVVLTLSGTLAQ